MLDKRRDLKYLYGPTVKKQSNKQTNRRKYNPFVTNLNAFLNFFKIFKLPCFTFHF